MRIGVLGGTGLYDWGPGERIIVETEHGDVAVTRHPLGRHDLLFAPRHGQRHERPAHLVDHHANVRAFAAAHVDALIGVFNVGSLDPTRKAGSFVVPGDLLDLSRGSPKSFARDATHLPFHPPFCPRVRTALLAGGHAPDGGVYASTSGPRFESPAEVRMLRTLGADVVGMTCGPEAALAREAGVCYGALCVVGNSGTEATTAREIQQRMARRRPAVRALVEAIPRRWPIRARCSCADARGAQLTLPGVPA